MRALALSALVALLAAAPAAAQLAGTYTVGGASPDYATPQDAADALAAQGVSGNAIFQIRPGTYDGGLDLGPISGVSEAARVRFEAADPANAPVLRRPAATSADNYVVRLDGADWVTLRDLDLAAAAPSPTGRLVVLAGDASNVTVRRCTLSGHAAPGSDVGSLIWTDGASTHDAFTLDQSTLSGGWRGLDLDAPVGGGEPTGLVVSNSTFRSQEEDGLRVRGDGRIEGNDLADDASAAAGYDAVTTLGGADGIEVVGNTIEVTFGIYGINGLAGTSLIANNFVAVRRNVVTASGIVATSDSRVLHNTVRVEGLASALALPPAGSATIEVRNNLLHADGAGPAIEDTGTNSIDVSDGNLLYTSQAPLVEWDGATYATLADWQAASGFDAGSISQTTDFAFVSATTGGWDLHLAGASLSDPSLIAPPVAEITTDADGDARDAFNPKRGADEGTPLPPLAGTYGVGVAPPGFTADFATLAEAVDAVHLLGVSAEVVFQLYDDIGPLPVTIRPFDGASATSRLRLIPLNAGLAFPYAATNAATNGALVIDGADWVSLEAMGFDTSGGTAPYGRALTIRGDVEGLRLAVPLFVGMTGQTDPAADLIGAEAATLTGLTITDGQLTNGARGLRLNAPGSTGTRIERLRVIGVSQDGIALRGHTAPVLEDVVVESTASVGSVTGIRLDAGTGGTVSGAQVTMTGGFGTGLTIDDQDGTSAAPVTVSNTFLTSASAGLLVTDAAHVRVVHTTVRAEGGSGALFETGGSSDLTLVNNVWVHAGSGRAVTLSAASVAAESRFNALVTAGTVFATVGGVDYDDLGDYRTGTGLGANSTVPEAVAFVDGPGGDLHLTGASEGDARLSGTPLADVTTDLDGDARSATQPYRGADEAGTPLPTGVQFLLTVALQGAFESADGTSLQMRTDLWDAGLVPAAQPYSDPIYDGTPLDYDGTETVDTTSFGASVDWVIVELRETPDGPAVARRIGLVAGGGVVNHPVTDTLVEFPVAPGAYHVVVRHRNHLPILTVAWPMSAVWSPDDGVLRSQLVANVVGGAAGGVEVEPGIVAMAAADGNADGLVTAPDFNRFSTASGAGAAGYVIADYTLDGLVTAPDFNLFSTNAAAGVASTVPEN